MIQDISLLLLEFEAQSILNVECQDVDSKPTSLSTLHSCHVEGL